MYPLSLIECLGQERLAKRGARAPALAGDFVTKGKSAPLGGKGHTQRDRVRTVKVIPSTQLPTNVVFLGDPGRLNRTTVKLPLRISSGMDPLRSVGYIFGALAFDDCSCHSILYQRWSHWSSPLVLFASLRFPCFRYRDRS
jgi:hypothetical protein